MKPVWLGGVVLFLACGTACAADDASKREVRNAQTDPAQTAKPLVPRRSVPMTVERVPPATPAPAPRVNPPAIAAPQPAVPQAPVPVTSCDAGGCWSATGRYSGGAGNTYLDKNGRPCQGNGIWMQCF
ncbi:MAG: hypothetical protein ACREX0_14820 [Noviherbaspirillum sp.]